MFEYQNMFQVWYVYVYYGIILIKKMGGNFTISISIDTIILITDCSSSSLHKFK